MPEIRVEMWRRGVHSPEFERALRGVFGNELLHGILRGMSVKDMMELNIMFRRSPESVTRNPNLFFRLPEEDFAVFGKFSIPMKYALMLRSLYLQKRMRPGELSRFAQNFDLSIFGGLDLIESFLFSLSSPSGARGPPSW